MSHPDEMNSMPGASAADLEALSDNPEWTEETSARSKNFAEMFPDIAQRLAGEDASEVTLRLEKRVIDVHRSGGSNLERRINDIPSDAAGVRRKPPGRLSDDID